MGHAKGAAKISHPRSSFVVVVVVVFDSFFKVVFQHIFQTFSITYWTNFVPHAGPMLGALSSFFRSQDEVLS